MFSFFNVCVYVWESKDNLRKLILYFQHVGPRFTSGCQVCGSVILLTHFIHKKIIFKFNVY